MADVCIHNIYKSKQYKNGNTAKFVYHRKTAIDRSNLGFQKTLLRKNDKAPATKSSES